MADSYSIDENSLSAEELHSLQPLLLQAHKLLLERNTGSSSTKRTKALVKNTENSYLLTIDNLEYDTLPQTLHTPFSVGGARQALAFSNEKQSKPNRVPDFRTNEKMDSREFEDQRVMTRGSDAGSRTSPTQMIRPKAYLHNPLTLVKPLPDTNSNVLLSMRLRHSQDTISHTRPAPQPATKNLRREIEQKYTQKLLKLFPKEDKDRQKGMLSNLEEFLKKKDVLKRRRSKSKDNSRADHIHHITTNKHIADSSSKLQTRAPHPTGRFKPNPPPVRELVPPEFLMAKSVKQANAIRDHKEDILDLFKKMKPTNSHAKEPSSTSSKQLSMLVKAKNHLTKKKEVRPQTGGAPKSSVVYSKVDN